MRCAFGLTLGDRIIEHDRAERARHRDLCCAGADGLVAAILVDARTDLFFHPHARTSGAAAEGLIGVTFHLHSSCTGGVDQLARRDVDLVVSTQVARVVIRHLLVDARDRGEAAFLDELVEQLRVVHDLEVAAELRVLAAQRVEAVRARDDDLARLDLVEDLDVLHGLHLEKELVACASRGIAGAGLAFAQHHELHSGDGE